MATATPNSVIVCIDDERIELTGQDALDYETTRAKEHQEYLDKEAKKAQTATDKAALLAKMGLTADELKTLLS